MQQKKKPRSSPNKPLFSLKRPQNNQFRYQNSSNINKLEPEFNQMTVIQQQQQEINTHSLRTSPISAQPYNSKSDHPPGFFISRREANMPQTLVKMMQTETIEVCRLSERNCEHI